MIKSFFLQPLEKALNRYLALDPESSKRLRDLEDQTLTLELLALNRCFQLSIHGEKIHLTAGENLPAAVKIRGTPLNLLALARNRDNRQHFFADTVVLEGNAELGQQIIDLFDQLEIDWEEYLAHFVGDLPAHQFSRFAHTIFAWGKTARATLVQNMNEYVHEEKPWFPPDAAVKDFFSDVDELRLALDRFEARVKHL